jgi:hypothetical protein
VKVTVQLPGEVTIDLPDDLAGAMTEADMNEADIAALCQGAMRDELRRIVVERIRRPWTGLEEYLT